MVWTPLVRQQTTRARTGAGSATRFSVQPATRAAHAVNPAIRQFVDFAASTSGIMKSV